MSDASDITQWLDAAREGDRGAMDRVLSTLYNELHGMARRQLSGQQGYTLDATSLVHESYFKLLGARKAGAKFDNRAHFFAYAASAMRSVVVDYARQRLAQKRGGALRRVTDLTEDIADTGVPLDEDVLSVDAALGKLAEADERLAKVVELRYFAGLSVEETASLLEVAPATVKRHWAFARAWLYRELADSP